MVSKMCILTVSSLVCILFSGCCHIPSNTPTLIDKTSERVETRSVVVTKTLRTVLDEVNFTKGDVEGVRGTLEGINTIVLSQDDQKAVLNAIKSLIDIEKALTFEDKYALVPSETERIFKEVVISLKLLKQIVKSEIDKKELVQDVINILDIPKGDEK